MKYWNLNRTSQILILLFFVLLGVHLLMGYRRFQEGTTDFGLAHTEFADFIWANGELSRKHKKKIVRGQVPRLCDRVDRGGIVNENDLVGVKYIGNYAFDGCNDLKSIQIPDRLTSIGDYAFRGSGLTSITIPNKVTSIGYQAFIRCKDLEFIIILPDSVTSIGESAFSDCEELKSIQIPDTGTKPIGKKAFSGCDKLEKVIITTSNPNQKDYADIKQTNMQKMGAAGAKMKEDGVNYEVKYVEKKSTGAGAGNSWDPYNKHKKFYKDIKKKCKRNKKCKKCSKKCHNKYIKCTKKQTKKLNKKQRKKPMSRAKFKNAIKKIQKKCDTDKGSLKCNAKCSRKFKLGLTTNT